MNVLKYAVVAAASACLALSLAGCSGSSANEANSSAATSASTVTAIDFDGSKCHDMGKGSMYLQTEAGQTSKKGKTPQVQIDNTTEAAQITLVTKKMTAKPCQLYIDGVKNTTIKPGTSQRTITLNADSLASGTHKIELVHLSKSQLTVYKKAKYEVVVSDSQS